MDSWVPGLWPLSDHAVLHINDRDLLNPVEAFSCDGDWNWGMLYQLLPPSICTKIACIRPPSPGAEDYPVLAHLADGDFSIKSDVNVMAGDLVCASADFPFTLVWKLRAPPRVNTFLWKVAHQRLMTNAERLSRGISDSDLCPRCKTYPESIMHLLQDCEGTL